MKRKFLQITKISFFLLLILSLSNPVSGLNGTDVWGEGGFIIFESDVKFIFNRAYYTVEEAPNVDISDGEITIQHTQLNNVGDMLFSSSSSNNFLSEFFFGGNVVTSEINPDTGLNQNGEQTFRFGKTENWANGEETDYKEIFEYTDDLGYHSKTLKYEVVGEKFEYSMKIDSVDTTVTGWQLEIDYELNYNDAGFSVQEKNLLQFIMTDGNGVLIQSLVRQELNVKAINDTTFETIIFFEFSMEAVKSEGVTLNPGSGSDSGFVSFLIPWTTIMTLTIMISFYRGRKV